MSEPRIIWPARYAPDNCPVFVHNEIEIAASPEQIWNWLIQAPTWPDWYVNASKVRLHEPGARTLGEGSRFFWRTFGVALETQVKEHVPHERLAWEALGPGVQAYHAWLIVPTAAGCKVITEETQHGWKCRLGKLLMPNRMYQYHQIWLQGLKAKAEGGDA